MKNKEILERILKSPVTKAAKGCFMEIEELKEIKQDLDRLEKVEKDLHYLKEQNIELFQFQNGRIILGIDITNMPSEVERVKRIIKTTLKEVLGNE